MTSRRRRAALLAAALSLFALGTSGLQATAQAAPAPAAEPLHLLSPRTVNFRRLPVAAAGSVSAPQPFRVPNPNGFALQKRLAQAGTIGRRQGVRTLGKTSPTAAVAGPTHGPRAPSQPEMTVTSYQGLDWGQNPGLLEPPDSYLAVGPTQVVETINVLMGVYDKLTMTPVATGPRKLDTLFGLLPGYNSTDPRVFFDKLSQRWFASEFAVNNNSQSQVFIAVSATADAAGTWNVYTVADSMKGYADSRTLFDQPKFAVTSDKVVMAWDDYSPCVTSSSCPFVGVENWVVDKSDLLLLPVPPPTGMVRAQRLMDLPPGAEGLLPVQPLTSTSTAYAVYNGSNDTTSLQPLANPVLGVRTITGTVGSLMVSTVTIPLGGDATSEPPNAAQQGNASLILTNDDRLLSAVWENGALWAAGNDGCFPAGATVSTSCVRLFRVATPPGGPYISENVDLAATPGTSLFFPALTFDGSGNLLAAFNESSASMYPSVEAAVPFASASASVTVKSGVGPYDWKDNCPPGENRWGDYSGAATDPVTGEVWVAGEYSPNPVGAVGQVPCHWSTALGKLSLSLPSTTFYFAEGYTGSGYQESLSMLVPNYNATAQITYQIGATTLAMPPRSLAAGKVFVEDVNADVPVGSEVSAQVVLSAPGTVERTIHFNDAGSRRFGSSDTVGASSPSTTWYFAEGSTLPAYNEYLTVQNPNASPATVTLGYLLDHGAPLIKTLSLPASSRTTVEVFSGDASPTTNPCLPGAGGTCGVGRGFTGVSLQLTSDAPIIAERPLYVNDHDFGAGPIRDGHVAFGATAPASTWYFAEGTTLPGFNEYLTLENPSGSPLVADLFYFTDRPGGQPAKSVALPPESRTTVVVSDGTFASTSGCGAGPGGSCGIGPGVTGVSLQVTARSGAIVAERPMYMVHDFGSGPVAGAHLAMGATSLAQLFGFAWASTQAGDNDYLTLQNPGSVPATVWIHYYGTSAGQDVAFDAAVGVPARARVSVLTFDTAAPGAGPGFSALGIVVQSDQMVLVEKPTYSANLPTYGATDTLGFVPPAGF